MLLTIVGCSVNDVDVVFAVDTSTSVGASNFELVKAFLNETIDSFDPVANRIGVVKYNDQVKTEFELNQMR